MKKFNRLLFVGVLLALFGCVKINAAASQAFRSSPDSAAVKSAVHRIICQEVGSPKIIAWGSSVNIQHTPGRKLKILTARHVIEGCLKSGILLLEANNRYALITPVANAKDNIDLTLVETSLPVITRQPTLPVASTQGREGDLLYVAGFPCCSGLYMLERATLANLQATSSYDNRDYLFLSSPVTHGNSGGPALNDHFEIIGINVQMEKSMLDTFVFHSFAVPLHEIKHFLKENNVPY